MYSTWIALTNQPITEKSVGTRGSMMCTDNYSEVFGDTPIYPLTAWTCYSLHYILQYPTYNISNNILQYPTEILVTLPKSVDFFAFFANCAHVLCLCFVLSSGRKTENQSNFLSENQSNPILLGKPIQSNPPWFSHEKLLC